VMLEETRDTVTVPATLMLRMLASFSHARRSKFFRLNLYSVGKIYIVSALLYYRGLCVCFSGQVRC